MKTGVKRGTEEVSKIECWYCGKWYMKSFPECPHCHTENDDNKEKEEHEEK